MIGDVAIVASSPGLGRTLGLAHIDVGMSHEPDSKCNAAGVRACSSIARTLSSPYVVPTSWSVPLF